MVPAADPDPALAPRQDSDVVGTTRSEAAHGNAQARRSGLALPTFGSRVLSASAVVACVAVGAAAILSRSVTEAVGRTRVGPAA